MKKMILFLACVVLTAQATLFTSCEAVEKLSEQDVSIGDFDFIVNTSAQNASRAGGTNYKGDCTITLSQLLEYVDFDYEMVKSATVEAVSIEIVGELPSATIENLYLSCSGLTSVTANNLPLTDIASSQQDDLKVFMAGLMMNIIRNGSTTVYTEVTFDRNVEMPTVAFRINVSDIVLRVGLNL